MEKARVHMIVRTVLLCAPLWAPFFFLSFYSCVDKHLCLDGISYAFYVFVSATLISFIVAAKDPARRKVVFVLPIFCLLSVLWILVSFFLGMGRSTTLDAVYSTQKDILVENLKVSVNKDETGLPDSIIVQFDISSNNSFHGRFNPTLELETSRVWPNELGHYTENLVMVSGDIIPKPEELPGGENLQPEVYLLGDYGYKKDVRYHFRANFKPAFIVGSGVDYGKSCFNTQGQYASSLENVADTSNKYRLFIWELPIPDTLVEAISFNELYNSYMKQGLPQCQQN